MRLNARIKLACIVILALCCSAASLFAQPASFQFAWLSDTHIGSPTAEKDLRASVRDINAMDSLAFVILSGDITELGWNSELELAKSILDSLRKPYYITPGNHDTKWSESGCTKFAQVFGSDRFVFDYAGYRFIGLHEGPIMRMGDGHFAPEDLRWIDSVLAHLPDNRQPLFFVTHYPLDSQLDNWYEMTDRLRRYNTQAVLCGHGHANKVLNFEGIPGIMCRSNLRAQQPAGGFTLVKVEADSMFFYERIAGSETGSTWHTISLGRRNHLADTTRFPRPDFAVNKKYPEVKAGWTVATGFTIASAPAIWKDVFVVGNSSGAVNCYSLESGARRWTFKTGASVYSTADIADGKVVFGSVDGCIYCLDVSNGNQIWKVQTAAPVLACPTIAGKIVYIGGSDRKFRALELSTGKVKWEFGSIGAFVETKPLVTAGKVIFGAWDTFLYSLNVSDGSLSWKWSNGTPTLNLSPAACWPVAFENKLFIVAPDRAMTAIDLHTGKELWRTKEHHVREALGISSDGSRVYSKCMNDTLFAFSSSSPTPQLLWATDCAYGYDIAPSMPTEKDGVVFFGHKNGTVFALDAGTGAVRWQHKIGNTIVNTVAPVDARRVIVTDFDGKVELLEESEKK